MKSQAIVAYGQPLEEVTSDIPTPTGTEVVVKITHSGVCHSDVHLQDGHVDLGDGDKLDWSKGRTLPHTLGHEIEGTLSAVGRDRMPPVSRWATGVWCFRGSAAASARCARPATSICATVPAPWAFTAMAASPRTPWCPTRVICWTTANWPRNRPAPMPAPG